MQEPTKTMKLCECDLPKKGDAVVTCGKCGGATNRCCENGKFGERHECRKQPGRPIKTRCTPERCIFASDGKNITWGLSPESLEIAKNYHDKYHVITKTNESVGKLPKGIGEALTKTKWEEEFSNLAYDKEHSCWKTPFNLQNAIDFIRATLLQSRLDTIEEIRGEVEKKTKVKIGYELKLDYVKRWGYNHAISDVLKILKKKSNHV